MRNCQNKLIFNHVRCERLIVQDRLVTAPLAGCKKIKFAQEHNLIINSTVIPLQCVDEYVRVSTCWFSNDQLKSCQRIKVVVADRPVVVKGNPLPTLDV